MANQGASLNGILLAGKVDSGALYLYWVVGRCKSTLPGHDPHQWIR